MRGETKFFRHQTFVLWILINDSIKMVVAIEMVRIIPGCNRNRWEETYFLSAKHLSYKFSLIIQKDGSSNGNGKSILDGNINRWQGRLSF